MSSPTRLAPQMRKHALADLEATIAEARSSGAYVVHATALMLSARMLLQASGVIPGTYDKRHPVLSDEDVGAAERYFRGPAAHSAQKGVPPPWIRRGVDHGEVIPAEICHLVAGTGQTRDAGGGRQASPDALRQPRHADETVQQGILHSAQLIPGRGLVA